MNKYVRGSEWRKWDLHVHTSASYDTDYSGADADDLLVAVWKEKGFAAVAITDHFKIDKAKIVTLREKAPDITIFPGVELRTDKGGCNIHVILIFSEQSDIKTLSDDFDAIMIRQKAKNKDDDTKIYWDYADIIGFAISHDAIISLHTGSKSNGLDKEITNALPVAQAVKAEYADSVHIFEIGKTKDITDYKTKVFPAINMEKPLIICSDNHNPREYKVKEFLWLKSDPTFCGLKQVINHPSERVYVGNIPPKMDQAKKSPEKYIDSFTVQKKLTARNSEKWFNFDIPLNIGLVSVIGNKGSGKSAFSDIVAHVCHSKNVDKSSFLSDTRFRKKPSKYADDYESKILWNNGIETAADTLQETKDGVELVKYLPQSYIERVCNELDNSFQREIDNVIFSYIDESERGAATTLEQIIVNKTSVVNTEMKHFLEQLDVLNAEIIEFEKKSTPQYKRGLSDLLKKKKDDYALLRKNPPIETAKPTQELDTEKDAAIQQATDFISKLETEVKNQREKINSINRDISDFEYVLNKIADIETAIADIYTRIPNLKTSNPERMDDWKIDFVVDKKTIEALYALKQKEKVALIKITTQYTEEIPEIDDRDTENSYDKLLQMVDSLDYKIKLSEAYKALLTNETTFAQRQYQKYLDDKKEWEAKKTAIFGDEQTKDTIKYLEYEIEFTENAIAKILQDKRRKRQDITTNIYVCLEKKVEIYNIIYQPIKEKISKLLGGIDDEVSFVAGISSKKSLNEEIVKRVNKKIKSHLYGIDGDKTLNDTIDSADFMNKNSLLSFVEKVLEFVTNDTDIEKIIKNNERLDFYNFIAGLSYLEVDFNLTMGDLSLEEMSPGQRGTVLLIFYLALDKDDEPLIIDQPEDNLDNQSVFDKLVPCILAAKKSRQIIIVTHNPNIAVACDSEQIISCKIDKHTHEITYMAGAIEEAEVKDSVVKILEGTQPAFDLRNKKYSYCDDKAMTP